MANREALRELQSRLAVRLEAAKTASVSASWLAVVAGGQNLLFPLKQSGEIFPFAGIQPVAYTQPWFIGVANLRGGLFGVIDLAGYVYAATPVTDTQRSEARLVTLNPALELNCALLVERLAGLRAAEAFTTSAPAADGAPPYFGSCHTDADGVSWQEINLHLLCQQERFLQIGA